MKWIVFFLLLTLFGCSSRVPYQDRGLDTTTNISTPTKGKAGVYVYQFNKKARNSHSNLRSNLVWDG